MSRYPFITPANVTYRELLKRILEWGNDRGDRTGTGTRSLFGEQVKFDLTKGFPLLTTKKIHWKSIVHELLWMISGSTNVKYLQENGVRIWNEWADENGDLGPVYGSQWRKWEGAAQLKADGKSFTQGITDQLSNVIKRIHERPEDRRLIVNAWKVDEIEQMKLPPCHVLYQFYTRKNADGGRYLDCHMYQRSADVFLGVPFNIAQYALLMSLVGRITGYVPGILTISFGDVHIYNNHVDQVREQISRDPFKYALPSLELDPISNIDDVRFENIKLVGYESFPSIKAEVAV